MRFGRFGGKYCPKLKPKTKYSQPCLNEHSRKRQLCKYTVLHEYSHLSLIDHSLKRRLPLSDHFFLHQGWSLKRELTAPLSYTRCL